VAEAAPSKAHLLFNGRKHAPFVVSGA
jgi:hypothetical protein